MVKYPDFNREGASLHVLKAARTYGHSALVWAFFDEMMKEMADKPGAVERLTKLRDEVRFVCFPHLPTAPAAEENEKGD